MKFAAFIPLRGGSKSVPRKNILPIAGQPLCLWSIRAAARAARIDHVFVATDSQEIRDVVEAAGLEGVTVIDRSPETATDTASTESAMLEFVERTPAENVVLIQATSPLLTEQDLDAGIEEFVARDADSLVSVVPQKRFLWTRSVEGFATPTNYRPESRPRRQDFEGHFVENGAFYVSRREGLQAHGSRLFGKIAMHVMPEETFQELDEPLDWLIIERLLQERQPQRHELLTRVGRIKMVLSDVDGVLTDSGMYYSDRGDELKKFNTRDGKGFELLRKAGYEVGIITAERTELVERRAAKLKLNHLVQGSHDKVADLQALLARTGHSPDQVAYVGDDLGDVGILSVVGLAACPRDATPEARAQAHFVSTKAGGEGVIREFAEFVLASR